MYQHEKTSQLSSPNKSLWAIGGVVLLATLWGATFLLIKLLVAELPAITSSFYRCVIASLVLFWICGWRRQSLMPVLKYLPKFAVMGFLGSALPFVACAIAEQKVDSGLAGIIEGATPLFVLVFGCLLGTQKKLNLNELVGVLLGFIGLLFLFSQTLFPLFTLQESALFSFFEESLLVLMAISFALSFIYSKEFMVDVSPLIGVTGQMVTATIFLALWQTIFIGWQQLPMPSFHAAFYQLSLGSTTALSWLLYFQLIQRLSVTEVSFAAYLCPVVAMLLGVLVLDEAVTLSLVLGLFTIVAALLIASGFLPLRPRQLISRVMSRREAVIETD